MSEMSYLGVIERYHEYREAIRELLASIVTGIGEQRLWTEEGALAEAITGISEHYPFVSLIYLLDEQGRQISPIVTRHGTHPEKGRQVGTDRSQRPYFGLVGRSQEVAVSEPYFSNIGRNLCVSAIAPCGTPEKVFLVVDIDLRDIIEFLMGDTLRGQFSPAFKLVYSLIALGLFAIVGVLLMFKSALGDGRHLQDAVLMMFSAVGLLVGLGLYVYLGARAESILRHAGWAGGARRLHPEYAGADPGEDGRRE